MFIIFLLIQFGIVYFLNLFGVSSEINTYMFILFNMACMISLFANRYKEVSGYLLMGYFARVLFMFWDIYAKHIFMFPGSGNDTEGFYRSAVFISNNIELIKDSIYGGNYSKILGLVFYLTGENRMLGQYLNVMLGVAIIILIYKSLKMLNIKKEDINLTILIISLFPNALIFSAILLRENLITFFVALSIYYFIKWHKEGKLRNQLLSIISILIASSFHSGVIGILIGYIFSYVLYNRKTNSLRISIKSIILLIMFIFIGITILNQSEMFLGKFKNIEEIDDIINATNSRGGGSQYLASLKMNSWWQMLIYSPIYIFYFLTSPLPWDWRGLNDIVTFFIDSSLYLVFIIIFKKMIKDRNNLLDNKDVLSGLLISALTTIFIFGIGVQNAGTAMRHRHKILPLLIIIFTILKEEKNDGETEEDI